MASCSILDIQCILVNEIFGNVTLAVIGGAIIYFLIAGKLKLGTELTLAIAVPVVIIVSLMIGGFQAVYAFATLLVSLMIAYIFNKIIGNR